MTLGVPGVTKHFSEVVEVQECLCPLKIVLYDYYKTSKGPKHFSEVVEAQESLCTLKIVLYDFYKISGTQECLSSL